MSFGSSASDGEYGDVKGNSSSYNVWDDDWDE